MTIAALVIEGVLIVAVILLIIFIRQRTVVKRAYVSASVLSDLGIKNGLVRGLIV